MEYEVIVKAMVMHALSHSQQAQTLDPMDDLIDAFARALAAITASMNGKNHDEFLKALTDRERFLVMLHRSDEVKEDILSNFHPTHFNG